MNFYNVIVWPWNISPTLSSLVHYLWSWTYKYRSSPVIHFFFVVAKLIAQKEIRSCPRLEAIIFFIPWTVMWLTYYLRFCYSRQQKDPNDLFDVLISSIDHFYDEKFAPACPNWGMSLAFFKYREAVSNYFYFSLFHWWRANISSHYISNWSINIITVIFFPIVDKFDLLYSFFVVPVDINFLRSFYFIP